MANNTTKNASKEQTNADAPATSLSGFSQEDGQLVRRTSGISSRDFIVPEAPLALVNELPITSVTIDIWSNSTRSMNVLDTSISIENLAHRLSFPDVVKKVAANLADSSKMGSIVEKLFPGTNMIHYNRPLFSRFFVFDIVSKTTKDVDSALVVTDLLTFVLSDLGVVSMGTGRGHFQLQKYTNQLPDDDAFKRELVKGEIEKQMNTTTLLLKREGRTAESSSLVKERAVDMLRSFAIHLRRVGEVQEQFSDLLDLVRIKLSPDTYATSGVDKDLVEHPAVVDLSMDATFVAMAVNRSAKQKRYLSDVAMTLKMDSIVAKIRDTTRFKRISKSEFADKYSKQTIINSRGEPRAVILSRNAAVSPAAQVIDDLIYNSTEDRHEIINQPTLEGFMQSAYGDLSKVMNNAYSMQLLASEYSKYVSERADGDDIGIPQVTSVGNLSNVELTVLSMAKADRTYLVTYSLDEAGKDRKYALAFARDTYGLPYTTISSSEIGSFARITDPAELLMLVDDWAGTYVELDRVQTLPNETIGYFVYGQPNIALLSLDKEHFVEVKFKDEAFNMKAKFVEMIGRGYLENNSLVLPTQNNSIAQTYFETLTKLHEIANVWSKSELSDERNFAASTEARLARELTSLYESLNKPAVDQLKSYIRDAMILKAKRGQKNAYSQLRRNIFDIQLTHGVVVILLQRLGLIGTEAEDVAILDNIRNSKMYAATYGVN